MNENMEGGAGKHAVPEATRAFAALTRDIKLVFNMDYRDATFQKWREVAKTAFEIYLGPMHPLTLEFLAIKWRDEGAPEPPAGGPVGQTDELLYSAGLESAKEILDRAFAEAKAREDALARLSGGPEKSEPDAKPKQDAGPRSEAAAEPPRPAGPIKIIRTGDGRESTPKAPPKTEAEPGEAPPGPVKILTKGGMAGETLEGLISSLDDPEEKSMVGRLKEEVDDSASSWEDIKGVMLEIYKLSPSLASRLLPIILKR